MLNEQEIECIEYMDYQVINNGMDGWLSNRGFDELDEFTRILYKRNETIDQKVASLFIRATTARLGYLQLEPVKFIPDVAEKLKEYENQIKSCNEEYQEIAKNFMESYGLKDYGTKFSENLNS